MIDLLAMSKAYFWGTSHLSVQCNIEAAANSSIRCEKKVQGKDKASQKDLPEVPCHCT